MRNRYLYGSGLALLAILLMLVFWQVSLSFGDYGPETTAQTFVFWGVSTLIFLLTVTVGFMLFREGVRLYMDRQSHREGSRIKSKLVLGALALSLLPVMFMLAFSYVILNRNVEKWFSRPAEGIRTDLLKSANAFDKEVQDRAQALANWIAILPAAAGGKDAIGGLCQKYRIAEIRIEPLRENFCPPDESGEKLFEARAAMPDGGELLVGVHRAADLASQSKEIARYMTEYNQIAAERNNIRKLYLLFLVLIALFVLFVATWIALKLSHHISAPISALLIAAGEVRKGNLGYRVQAKAGDELATLIRAFNEMMQELEANSRELESRRRFTEAILESIPTGVLSLAPDGRIQRGNRALHGLFPEDRLASATYLGDLFPSQDAAELEYLMKRARRTGVAASQIDIESPQQVLHLAVTVSALPARHSEAPGFVVVLEDTSELLRAQKAAAWHEVARRIAHELKNPLTPIALCAERIARQLDRGAVNDDSQRILRECSATIAREVESVKSLADEFSRFSRFPAAQPVPSDLNEITRNALDVFAGRLEGVDLRVDLGSHLPLVNVDPGQFKRVIVNLVDNAAEAMRESPLKRLLVATRANAADSVELLIADTGCGISAEDKEKLFLPYFSTKGRGTGLGLAIVNHILSEHGARIRVEDNRPAGARFIVEVQAAVMAEAEARA
ncbi:MAG TPA: ATP-binding protein [Bryobacteraceae bacterium]|jgi:two-component system nitrogen regulation sensor histidine kinase NtrY|nr:ATP-binding protein [Bryobacteraceae bacterium]